MQTLLHIIVRTMNSMEHPYFQMWYDNQNLESIKSENMEDDNL